MNPLVPMFLAAVTPEDLMAQAKPMDSNTTATLIVIVCGTFAGVLAGIFIWLRSKKRPHRHHHHHHSHHRSYSPAQDDAAESEDPEHGGRHRRRRRRRPHRSRNPTLAETGGLPPVRGEEPPAGYPPV